MNKTFLFFIGMLLSFVTKSQSQFGIKAGVNLADQDKSMPWVQMGTATAVNTKPLVGYQLGAFYKKRLHAGFWLSAEANFSVIGSAGKVSGLGGETYNAQEKLGYIELPVTVQYKIGKIYFGVGPSVGFRVFSKYVNVGGESYDIPYYRTLNAAGCFLGGYKFSKKLDVNVSYNHGLMTISKGPGYVQTKNRFINLSLLYSIK